VQLGRLAVAVAVVVAAARVSGHEAAGEHETESTQAGHEETVSLDLIFSGLGHGSPSGIAHRGCLPDELAANTLQAVMDEDGTQGN